MVKLTTEVTAYGAEVHGVFISDIRHQKSYISSYLSVMKSYDNLVDALADLKQQGYTTDFNLAFDQIKCSSTGICLLPSQFSIVAHHRFEGDTDPSNSSILYVIESLDHSMKGTLINAYGAYSDALSDEMIRKLTVSER